MTGDFPTTIRAKAWTAGQTAPSSWTLTQADSEGGLQRAGDIGLRADADALALTGGPVIFSIDGLRAATPK